MPRFRQRKDAETIDYFTDFPPIMTETDLQRILQIDADQCRNLLDSNMIPSFTILESRRILKSSLVNYIQNMVSCAEADTPPTHLDNRIDHPDCMPPKKGVDGMAYKINRAIMIDGKKRWIHANSEQEYAEKLAVLFAAPKREPDGQQQKHNFREYALNWFEIFSKPNIATVTAVSYKSNLNLYILPAFGDKDIEDITVNDVQALFNSMKGAKATKDKCKVVLNQILEMAVDDDLIPKNPLKSKRIKIKGDASETTPTYTIDQMRYIISNLSRIQNPRDRAYMAIQALHPLRLEEVLGLQWGDIDTERMTLHVVRVATHPTRNLPEVKEPKTEASKRYIDLNEIALQYLTRGKDSDFVVGGERPLSYQQVKRMCQRIEKDIDFDDRITPIRFRTTVLTDIYDRTKDLKLAQAAAGHTTAAMTLKYYVKGRETDGQMADAVKKAYLIEQ